MNYGGRAGGPPFSSSQLISLAICRQTRYTESMSDSYVWYQALIKPSWAPPSWLFGPVWSILYTIIAITFAIVFYRIIQAKIPAIIALPFVLNLISNALFTPLQFGLRSNLLASIDIAVVLGTLIWSLLWIYPYLPLVSLVNIPYLAWVSFATVLQFTITYLNRSLS